MLSTLSASDLLKENEKYYKDTDSTKNEDYDADEILKKIRSCLIQQKSIKLLEK